MLRPLRLLLLPLPLVVAAPPLLAAALLLASSLALLGFLLETCGPQGCLGEVLLGSVRDPGAEWACVL